MSEFDRAYLRSRAESYALRFMKAEADDPHANIPVPTLDQMVDLFLEWNDGMMPESVVWEDVAYFMLSNPPEDEVA